MQQRSARGWSARSAWWRLAQRFGIALLITTSVVVSVVTVANTSIDHELAKVHRIKLVTATAPPEGENFLVIGSDSRAFVDDPQDAAAFGDPATDTNVQGSRSDTLLVVHVEPNAHRTLIVSFPRDLLVTIPGTSEPQKINAAFELGGAQLVIDTLKANFGIDIHHYVAVEFQGFKAIVDAIGTVPVSFEYPTRDRETGLDEPAGCQSLDGADALAYVRSRTTEQLIDGAWQYVGQDAPDLHRIQRQQDFIRRVTAIVEEDALEDPSAAMDVVDNALGALQVDSALGRTQVGELVTMLRSFDANDPVSLQLETVPTTPNPDNPLSSLVLQQPGADAVFEQLRTFSDEATATTAVAPSDIEVTVTDSSNRSRARAVATALRHQQLHATSQSASAQSLTTTEIRYSAARAGEAKALIAFFPSAKVVRVDSRSSLLEVALGDDFSSITIPRSGTTTGSSTPTSSTAPATSC